MSEAAPPRIQPEDDNDVEQLRAVLEAAGYTEAGIRDIGLEPGLPVAPSDGPVLEYKLDESPLSTLVRLFLIGSTVGREDAAKPLQSLTLEQLEAWKLVEDTPEGVRALVRIDPFEGLYLACDRHSADLSLPRPDYVIGAGPTSKTLSTMTIRRDGRRALDLGTGCGVQALMAARHSAEVVATDINPRALAFATFNARLNGVSDVDLRHGSLFEPVDGLKFDLVVANPPYVISPDSRFQYRDGGYPGDTICREIVQRIPEFLEEDGFAHVLCNWIVPSSGDWATPLKSWVEGNGCDVLLLHHATDDLLTYTAQWNRSLYQHDYGAWARLGIRSASEIRMP